MRDPSVPAMSHWRQALWIVLASTIARLLMGALVPLFADEAYYWEWSRRLALGYFDHPPVIAWLIAAGTALFGDTALGVRALPILCGGLLGLAIARTACHLAGESAARFAALCFALAPGWAAGLVLATPDAPMFAAMAWTLYAVVRAVGDDLSSREAVGYWILAGVTIGVAMASKYSAVFLPAGVAIAFLVHPPLRRQLLRPGPWMAVAVASLVMLPVLLWNAQHDWISFRFQLAHGLAASPHGQWWTRELALLGAQFALLSPVLFVASIIAVVRAFRPALDSARVLLGVVAVTSAAVFVFSATRQSVEANWPMIAWIPALILLGALRPAMRTPWEHRATWVAGFLTTVIVLQALYALLPISAARDPIARAHGWREIARLVSSEVDLMRGDSNQVLVAGNRYQDAALLAWHMRGHPEVTSLNIGSRGNQYDLWPPFTAAASPGADLLLVLKDTSTTPPDAIVALGPYFLGAVPSQLLHLRRGNEVIAVRRLWRLVDWTGAPLPDPISTVTPSTQ